MTDHDLFDRGVADVIVTEGATHVPPGAVDELLDSTSRVRPLPRWLALIKEPPMRHSSALAVGSPTVRAAAILVSALLLLALAGGAVAGAARLLAPPALIVAADGSGQYLTIGEAVEAASDGDTIEIRPGRYAEVVQVVGMDLTIRGVGDRAKVVVEAVTTPDSFGYQESGILAFYLSDTASTIANVTISGPDGAYAVAAVGPTTTPTLERLSVTSAPGSDDTFLGLLWEDGAAGRVVDSDIAGAIEIGSAGTPEFDDNRLAACIWVTGEDARPTFTGNRVFGCDEGFLVVIGEGFAESSPPASGVFMGNDFQLTDAERGGFSLGNYALLVNRSEVPTEVRDNIFHDSMQGVGVRATGAALIEDNTFIDNQTAIWVEGDDVEVRENRIRSSSLYGMLVHGSPVITDNTVESNLIGINLGANARPLLQSNELCDNETHLKVPDGNPTPLEGNTICGSAS